MTGARLTTAAEVLRFVQAGKAVVTLRSLKTGERFTYRIVRADDGKALFVHLLTGPDNEADFHYLGVVLIQPMVSTWRHGGLKSCVPVHAPANKAWAWTWKQVTEDKALHPQLEVWHEGRCGRCGRRLTTPESIALGLGPECAQRAA